MRDTRSATRPAQTGRPREALLETLTLHVALPLGGVLAGWLVFTIASPDQLPPLQKGACAAGLALLLAASAFAIVRSARTPASALAQAVEV